jgi:DNA-binding MarR family transcriptional regulator
VDAKTPAPSRSSAFVKYDPDESIGYQLRRTSREMAALLKAQIASENITIGMWYFLRALWERDGVIQRELTDYVGTMQPTTVMALRNMQGRGLIRMERDRTDRRSMRIFLTKEGRRIKNRLLPKVAEINRIAIKGVNEKDAAVFMAVLKKVYANAESAIDKLGNATLP